MDRIGRLLGALRWQMAENARVRRNDKALRELSDEILKDIGCRREDIWRSIR